MCARLPSGPVRGLAAVAVTASASLVGLAPDGPTHQASGLGHAVTALPTTAASVATLELAAASVQPQPALTAIQTQALVWRIADYVRRYEKTMATVVLEEQYVQLLKRWSATQKQPDTQRLAWVPGYDGRGGRDVYVHDRRQTRADLLLVQLPDTRWWAFRDVLEVDGRRLAGREDRLRKLFLEGTDDSRRQLKRINEASADYNLGTFYREVNLPTVGLMVFGTRYRSRFRHHAGDVEHVGEAACRVVSFTETSKPTVVQTIDGKAVPLAGSACVDAAGVVWRTRVELVSRASVQGVVEVVYGAHERVDVLVPVSMWEWYRHPRYDPVEAMATYSNLRQFSATASVVPM
jgi:hypothetical protein